MATKRYSVRRAVDAMGGRYATGPLHFCETDDFGAAQQELVARGGLLIDHQKRRAWSTETGWLDAGEYPDLRID